MESGPDTDLSSLREAAAAAPPSIDRGGGDGPMASSLLPPLPPLPPSSSSSSDSDGEEDEGWASFLAEENDGGLDVDRPVLLCCRVKHLELPVTFASFLGIEKEELVVTCQLLVGDGDDDAAADRLLLLSPSSGGVFSPHALASPEASYLASPCSSSRQGVGFGHGSTSSSSSLRVASTRLPSSFLPSKGLVCWEQRLDVVSFRLDHLLAPGIGPVQLRLMLWASASSALLGQVEVPLLLPPIPAEDDSDEEAAGADESPVLQLGVQRVTLPIFPGTSSRAAARAPPGRRESAVEPEVPSRKRQLPPRWRRAASESVRGDAAAAPAVPLSRLQLEDEEVDGSEQVCALRPFAWPAQGQLVIDVSLLQQLPAEVEGSDERKDEGPGAGEAASPMAAAEALLARPLDLLSREEAGLLWGQRAALLQDGRALVKLLRAVLAYGPLDAEGAGPAGVLEAWAAAGCGLSMLDAMKLLGRHFPDPAVRAFALQRLERAGDDELELFLLQLVQLLRYEPWAEARGAAVGGSSNSGGSAEEPSQPSPSPSLNVPPLARLLIDRACRSLTLGNALFWFLTAEMQTDRVLGRTFEAVRFAFLYTLNERNAPAYALLSAQEGWLKRIFKAYQRVLDAPGLRERKQAMLRELLAADDAALARPALPSVPLPLDPSLRTTGIDPAAAAVYGSKTYPVFLSFALAPPGDADGASPAEDATERDEDDGDTTTTAEKVLIFKMREDLRQDQLVLQLVRVADGLLRAAGLDLRLTPYRVRATGQQEGVVEYVPGAVTIADIMAARGGGSAASSSSNSSTPTITNNTSSSNRILAFLQHHRPHADAPLGVQPAAMDAYVRSLAGYCVLTHLLGIGDRHLHNIMLCPSGRCFHIDFGFILGRDPKAAVPRGPFRLAPAMVEGMGGREHPNFAAFKRLCVAAFTCLRGHARLLLGLLGLMVDANLKDLCPNPGTAPAPTPATSAGPGGGSIGGIGGSVSVDRSQSLANSLGLSQGTTPSLSQQPQPPTQQPHHPEAARVLARIERRFRLDLGNDEAAIEQHFVGLIHKALGALGPQVVEVLHNLAVIAK